MDPLAVLSVVNAGVALVANGLAAVNNALSIALFFL